MLVVARCSTLLEAALAARVQQELTVEAAWWRARRAEMPDDLTPRRRTAWLAADQAAFEAEQAAGRLKGTRSAVVVPALRDELAARGWLEKRWRPVPAGYRSRKARPLGVKAQRWEKRVPLDIPDDLAEVAARGSYGTSAPHIAALQRWYLKHGKDSRTRRRPGTNWLGVGPSNAELEQLETIQAAIITTGMIWRAAMCRALGVDPAGEVTRSRPPVADSE
jgi:hypothetical protein